MPPLWEVGDGIIPVDAQAEADDVSYILATPETLAASPEVQALIEAAETRGRNEAIEAAAKRCDAIAGNTKDFSRDYRRAAGHCAVETRSLKKGQ